MLIVGGIGGILWKGFDESVQETKTSTLPVPTSATTEESSHSPPDTHSPPAQLPAELVIESNIPKATVTIDGKDSGLSGSTHTLAAGHHTVQISSAGYEPFETSIQLAAAEKRTLPVILTPKPAQLVVRSNILGDTVTIDGKVVGSTGPDAHALTPGKHTVRVEKVGYESSETIIQLVAGEEKIVRTTLKELDPYANWRILQKIQAHPKGICLPHCIEFSPDGRTLLSGSFDDTFKLWDVASGQKIRTFHGHLSDVRSVTFSLNGRTILSGSRDGTLKLWDVASGKALRTLKGHSGDVRSVAFAPDGRTVLSGSWDNTLKLWDVVSGREIRTFEGHSESIRSVAFGSDGHTILSGSYDNTLKLWDVANSQTIRTFRGHFGAVWSVAFSPDKRTVLSGSRDDTLKLWNIESGQMIRTFERHSGDVNSVTFASDGRTVLSGSDDKTLKLWDVASGKVIHTLEGHSGIVRSVAFSPDGLRAASGDSGGVLILWGSE
uniref:WD domain-containing protein, G-beta repeat-containing protein n=1 Tax=Candidatus Kentrum sp. LFY TaxID=2126342 RepID=A0A450UVE1_9GAMM|nr:MAG: WD domain-containing protein, G-beta repeat-containing protein [Candidatus Kentron sp. LFY]